MDNERFEDSLRRATIRPIPAHWRAEILSAAREAQKSSSAPAQKPVSPAIPWIRWLCSRRLAWGGLAAAWVVIFTLNWAANRPGGPGSVEAVFSPEVVAVALRQSQLLASGLEDVGRAVGATEKQRPAVDRPRSARGVTVRVV